MVCWNLLNGSIDLSLISKVIKMTVFFNAQKALCAINITPELKQRFELVILKFAEQVLLGEHNSKLENITITDHFVEDVLAFQREHLNGIEGVTSNEYGRAFGKMIYVPSQEKYHVFLDSEYGSFLIDDEIMDVFISRMNGDRELINNIVTQRKCAMNLLAHELEHYKFANNQVAPGVNGSFENYCERVMFELFDEYNASRRAIEVSPVSVFTCDEEYMLKIETYIMDQRLEYNKRKISLNQFVSLFHQYTRQALMYIAANVGSKHGVKNDLPVFEKCRCFSLIKDLEQAFGKLFSLSQQGEKIVVSRSLVKWLKEYYELFGVYISETAEGWYYEIPFNGE